MAVTEVERHSLVQGLIDTLGEERTETLMKCILPEGWDQFATKQDVELVGERLRAEFGELRGEFGERFGQLRGEFGELRGEFGELRGEFGELRGEFGERFGPLRGEFGERFGQLRGEFGELRGEVKELKGYIDSALAKQTRIYLVAMFGFVILVLASNLAPQFL